MLVFLDIFLTAFHTAFTLFNLLGWIWVKTRRIHLITITLTLLSWLILGIWYGLGYCPLTDWHWDVKRALGERVRGSFNKYMLDIIFNYDFDRSLIDWITAVALVVVIVASVYLNYRDWKIKTDKPINSTTQN